MPFAAPRFLPVLFLLFVASGCAALIYEIVWFQLLQLVIGSSAVSLAVLLGTFMGGMCLGSLALPRFLRPHWNPLRTYAWIEIAIAVLGLLVMCAMPAVGRLYLALIGHGLPGIFLRAVICVLCLLPPTVLMGATLPVIARWIGSIPHGMSWLGFFYGGNTAGAVLGCIVTGFYLLRVHDSIVATYCAVALNIFVAAFAFALSRFEVNHLGGEAAPETPPPPDRRSAPRHSASEGSILVAIALSGFCALAAEVVWTRNLSLLLGATVYTFSLILAVFLAGLGLGSSAGAFFTRGAKHPSRALAVCQFLQVLAVAWAAHTMAKSLPYWTISISSHATSAAKFELDLVRCAWAILPAAILWGASFPLALAATAGVGLDPARSVGRIYAANTVGAIFGAVLTGLLLIPLLGTQATQILLLGLCVMGAIIALWPHRRFEFGFVTAAIAITILVGLHLPPIPWQLIAYGRQTASTDYGAWPIYFGEGINASVAVSQTKDGARYFHVSGKTEASSLAKDMRLQRMLGHIPALLHPNPRSVLIVGCGAGVTSGSFVRHPSIRRIVICDIEPLIPRVVATHFTTENLDVLHDPRVEIVYDDARHFIATTDEKFDLITSDPIHPWVKGSAVLYSQEYFELCKRRLNPGGLVTQWVPLYEANLAVVRSEIATFFSVFPHGTIWANDDEGFGYDTVLLGQNEPLHIDMDALQLRFDRLDRNYVQTSLHELGIGSALDLLSTYAGRRVDLESWLASAEINRDRDLRLQYLAGRNLESQEGEKAYAEILSRRQFPEDIFQATPARMRALRSSLIDRPATPVRK